MIVHDKMSSPVAGSRHFSQRPANARIGEPSAAVNRSSESDASLRRVDFTLLHHGFSGCSYFYMVATAAKTPGSQAAEKKMATRLQCAALPFRINDASMVEVMLVTTRETKRWIIPKGWPQKYGELWESAAREANEEAGVIGIVCTEPIGSFWYNKRVKTGETVPCEVQVFPLQVRQQRKNWPERGQREISWFPSDEAAEVVCEPMLGNLIRDYFKQR